MSLRMDERINKLTKPQKKKRMDDRISMLPESLLCHILSLLPTKEAVATSLLSKHWNSLWRSVSAIDFQCNVETEFCCVDSLHAFLHSRNIDQSIQRIRFKFCSHFCYFTNVYNLVTPAWQNRLVELDLVKGGHFSPEPLPLPSPLLNSKTLVILKLTQLYLKTFSSIDLPSLQILHLKYVRFSGNSLVMDVLSGCPNLEVLEVYYLTGNLWFEPEIKKLSKLTRAVVGKTLIPYQIICDVQFLRLDSMNEEFFGDYEMSMPEFHNLTYMELDYGEYVEDWSEVFTLLNHCPNLQNLVIIQDDIDRGSRVWQYPSCVPRCISSQLKTCCFHHYYGSEYQFEFVKYVLQNAKLLQEMSICSCYGLDKWRKLEILKDISSYVRLCSTCKLSFS